MSTFVERKEKRALDLVHVLEQVMELPHNSPLSQALAQNDYCSIPDLCTILPNYIEALEWTDVFGNTQVLPVVYQDLLQSFQHFVRSQSYHSAPSWITITAKDFAPYKPVLPDTTEDGEQLEVWGATMFMEFDLVSFQDSMAHATNSEDVSSLVQDPSVLVKPTKDPSITVLNDTILFFETYCLDTDFEEHSMEDHNVPSDAILATMPSTDKTSPPRHSDNQPYYYAQVLKITKNKTSPPRHSDNQPYHYAPVLEKTKTHMEYPDVTKFVPSMNDKQYQELKSNKKPLSRVPLLSFIIW